MAPVIGLTTTGATDNGYWGALAAILFVVGFSVAIWIGATIKAPKKQRDELREMYANTAAAIFGAGYERYISMAIRELEPYLSQLRNGQSRITYETGRIFIEHDDGTVTVLAIEPPGNVSSRQVPKQSIPDRGVS